MVTPDLACACPSWRPDCFHREQRRSTIYLCAVLEVFSLKNRIEYARKVFGWEVTQQMSGNSGVRMKFWTTYLLVTATFVLFALELLVRLLNLAPPLPKQYGNFVSDTYLPYKPRPSSTISGRTDEFDFEYKHNSLGFRDVEHTPAKPEGVFYILGLGDSFTYGVGISFEESYLFRLEKMLNERQGEHPRVEIIKAGIPRFFPEAERLLLQYYGIKFNPDLILIGFLVNDVMDTFWGIEGVKVTKNGYLVTSRKAREMDEREGIGEISNWLYVHSHLFRIMLRKYTSCKMTGKYQICWPDIYKPNGHHEKDWQKIEFEYAKIIELAQQVNAKVAIIHIPPKGPWDDAHFYPASRLSKWCGEQGVTFIDVLPAMKEVSQHETLYWEEDVHCNSAGYRVIAETVYSRLIEKALVP